MSSQTILRGSHREHPANSVPVGKPAPQETIQITLLLRRRISASEPAQGSPALTYSEFAEAHGAAPDDIRLVTAFAGEHGFAVERIQPAARLVTVSGRITDLAEVFGADLELRQIDASIFRTRQGALHIPAALHDVVEGVFGFDQRQSAKYNYRVTPHATPSPGFTPGQVAAAYNFPKATGAGQTIALIELGGGYNGQDLQAYWQQMDVPPVSVVDIGVDGASNAPTGDPSGPDGEVVLDIQVAGAVAPGAKIAVYFAPNTDQGFLNAIITAVHDQQHKPSVISISWGAAEKEWTAQSMNAFNSAFHDAALLGITVLAAAGDNGSSDGEPSGKHVDFPASSPWVLACGGTRLHASNGVIQSETVWNDGTNGGATGGGISGFFPRPSYQSAITMPAAPAGSAQPNGRGVPDIAAVADPETGYLVLVDGEQSVVGGTSAVAPLWAGLLAICNQELGKSVGWLHPTLYAAAATKNKALHDIKQGNNGAYSANSGWDCCTGLGTPNGLALLDLLKQSK